MNLSFTNLKNITAKISITLMVILAFAGSPAQAQFNCNACTGNQLTIVNPSFENGTTGWTSSGGTFTSGTGAVACGSKSGDFQITNNTDNWVHQTVGTDLPVGTTLTAKVYAGTHDNSFSHKIGLAFFDANWNWISESYASVNKVLATAPAGPQLYTINTTVPANCKYTVAGFTGNGNWIKSDAWCISYTHPTNANGSIGDRVWFDANGNGLQDASETTGITGVQVQLKNSGGTVIRTATTDASGNYSFTGLTAGNYTVVFPVSLSGSVVTTQNVGSNDAIDSDASQSTGATSVIALAVNQNITNVDAGYCPTTLQLGNRVWYDENANGLNDSEDGIRGITVYLYKDNNNDNVPDGASIATDVTDADGYYNFTNLAPGNYIIGIIKPAGYISSPVNGGDPDNNINLDDNGQIEVAPNEVRGLAITLVAGSEPDGDNNITYDFGLLPDCACTTSNSNLLVNGNFENGNTGWSATGGNLTTGTGYVACGAKNGFNNWTSGTSYVYQDVTVTPGATVTFTGFAGTHTPGITCSPKLQLQFFTSNGTSISITSVNVTRDVDVNHGQLEQYKITAVVPANASKVRVQSAITCNTMKIDAFCLTTTTPPATGSIGDRVWFDANGNGIQDASETTGITGVTVQLRNASGTVIQTKVTDANGLYNFTGVAAGTYTVAFPVSINGSVVTRQNQGTNDNVDSDPSQSTGITGNIVLASGQVINNVDAGYCPTTLVIGNFVWNDLNNNGIQDAGEPGISGATVNLYADADANGTPDAASIATTTTNGSGIYTFNNLAPGSYIVGVVLPTGFSAGTTTATSATPDNNNLTDNNGITLVGNEIRSSFITISGGGEPTNDGDNSDGNLTLDFALRAAGSIGDFVFNDLNGNGIQDANEPGLAGVTVTLTNSNGTVVGTVTTTANGSYLFPNLAPGTYSVSFSTPTGFTPAPANQGTNDNLDSDPVNGVVTNIVVNGQNLTIDAGFITSALSLGNFVFNDANNNGLQDAGEQGISGVSVKLYLDANNDNIADGAAVATTTTSGNGVYNFTDLAQGRYIVSAALPAGYAIGTTTLTSLSPDNNNNTDNNGITLIGSEVYSNAITLAPGTEPASTIDGDGTNGNQTLDFGFRGTGSIGDFVFFDANQDGIQNAGETGIANVTVTLTLPGGATRVTTTDANGLYQFTNLAPGTYSLNFTTPAGHAASPANVGTDDTRDSDPVNGTVSGIVLAPGQNNVTVDAGFGFTVRISGNVWNDANALLDNQVNRTSNVSIPVGINVYLVDKATNTILQAGGYENDGTYFFDNVQTNKTYIIVLSSVGAVPGQQAPRSQLPSGWRNTGQNLGAGPNSGSDGINDGKLEVDVEMSDLDNANFGIRKKNGEVVVG